ncbi:MAG: hypothetical protein A3F51_02005 [Candidatus Taylorbacteria bacterium RIFCSPHIGHO2_12_FULL_45_16]|uniref:Uncharacterized protein n=1 Tax=Candidatus Taylorbacteria bacterium RIFCSPHIGHO2_12_FULL_45_16 TaxID=1802315 RepID=A0A1G2MYV4_9BACT|nr:MAG: hypothetical protein A3F51_02005 [Candidatus Taylorbacteria bacterium RIFCSPHIGHO2_12_FULL_45_16]
MNTNDTEQVKKPVPYYRTMDRKIFVWVGNATLLASFVILTAMGLEYITPFAFGACVLAMCYFVTIILFFLGGYKKFLAPVADLHAGVLINRFFGRKAPKTDTESLSLKPAAFLEEVSSGIWNSKFPWQSVTYVNLQRHVAVGGKPGESYSYDQIAHTFLWFGTVRAVQGYCCTLVRIGAQAAINSIEGLTDAAVSVDINKRKWKEIIREQAHLAKNLEEHYGGDGNMSDKEAGFGLAIERLVLRKVTRSKELQDSAELVERNRNLREAVRILKGSKLAEGTHLTDKEATDRVLMEAGKGDLRVFEGLEGMGRNVLLNVDRGGNK